MDLTPYYGFEEDAVHFHATCRKALDPFGNDWHPRFKKWCDEYFFLRHRNEPRGVGGIFFDDLNSADFDTCFNLTQSVGDHFLPAYVPIFERRKDLTYGERERDFQAYRRFPSRIGWHLSQGSSRFGGSSRTGPVQGPEAVVADALRGEA